MSDGPIPYVAQPSDRYLQSPGKSRFWKFTQGICRIGTTLAFDLKVTGTHHIPQRGGVLLLSNHQSYLDPVLLGVQLERSLSFLAKSELFENPAFAWLIRSLNAFPVKQRAGDVGAMKETIKRLKEGHLLTVYPEGTRSDDGKLSPIQPGASLVIRRAGVPVVPAVIVGSFEAWPLTQKIFRPHPIRVAFGPAMMLDHMKADKITQWIDTTLNKMFDELRAQQSTPRTIVRDPRVEVV